MRRRDLDPDSFLRERLFQPVVDRWGIDPRPTALALLRIHVVGMIGGAAAATAITQTLAVVGGSSWRLPSIVLLVFAMAVFQVWLQVRRPAHESVNPYAAVQRIIWMGMLAVAIVAAVRLSISAATTSTMAAIAWAVVLAWAAGVCAAYLNTCRKPPPRQPKESRTGNAKWASAG